MNTALRGLLGIDHPIIEEARHIIAQRLFGLVQPA